MATNTLKEYKIDNDAIEKCGEEVYRKGEWKPAEVADFEHCSNSELFIQTPLRNALEGFLYTKEGISRTKAEGGKLQNKEKKQVLIPLYVPSGARIMAVGASAQYFQVGTCYWMEPEVLVLVTRNCIFYWAN